MSVCPRFVGNAHAAPYERLELRPLEGGRAAGDGRLDRRDEGQGHRRPGARGRRPQADREARGPGRLARLPGERAPRRPAG